MTQNLTFSPRFNFFDYLHNNACHLKFISFFIYLHVKLAYYKSILAFIYFFSLFYIANAQKQQKISNFIKIQHIPSSGGWYFSPLICTKCERMFAKISQNTCLPTNINVPSPFLIICTKVSKVCNVRYRWYKRRNCQIFWNDLFG